MIYLYGLMKPDASYPTDRLSALPGVTGAVMSERLEEGHLIYSPHDGTEIKAKRRLLLAHTKTLEDLSDWATVLPMQFGLLADGLSEVADMTRRQSTVIASEFARLTGHVEYGLRVSFQEKAALNHTLSTRPDLIAERDQLTRSADHFLKAEFGRKLGDVLERRRSDAQHAFLSALKPKVTDVVLRAPENEYQVINAHVLLPAERKKQFAPMLTELAETLDFASGSEAAISLVGPAPLYNFVRLNLAAAVPEHA